MKFIAQRDFRNVPALGLKDDDGKSLVDKPDGHKGHQHHDHIHKGSIIEIGTADNLKALQKADARKAEIAAHLLNSGCVAEADDKTIKLVREEVEIDRKREAAAAKMNSNADAMALVQQLVTLLGGKVPAEAK